MFFPRSFKRFLPARLAVVISVVAPGMPLLPQTPDFSVFSRIITPTLIRSQCKTKASFAWRAERRDDSQLYVALLKFRKTNPGQHYSISIEAFRGGARLNPEEFEKRYRETEQREADRGEKYLRSQFPQIGKRAERSLLGAGPGGVAYSLTFTTSDEKYDVVLTVSSRLPATTPDPGFQLEAAARRIASSYDRLQTEGKGAASP